eukprot:scaffold183125_cov32-Tisochrysis_lutea.AAC.1
MAAAFVATGKWLVASGVRARLAPRRCSPPRKCKPRPLCQEDKVLAHGHGLRATSKNVASVLLQTVGAKLEARFLFGNKSRSQDPPSDMVAGQQNDTDNKIEEE